MTDPRRENLRNWLIGCVYVRLGYADLGPWDQEIYDRIAAALLDSGALDMPEVVYVDHYDDRVEGFMVRPDAYDRQRIQQGAE